MSKVNKACGHPKTKSKLKINTISIGENRSEVLERFSNSVNGSIINLSGFDGTSRLLILRSSVDLELIDREMRQVTDQSEALVGIKSKCESRAKGSENTAQKIETEKSQPTQWIPSRDTLLTKSRKKILTENIRPKSAKSRISRSAQSPAVLHSRQFYLHAGSNLSKGQTIFLDASVKPPPVIPSCLKVPENEPKSISGDWLKRHGLNALKINLNRWERRITHGSKVYRGVLPVVRDRHCELQLAELEQLELLSHDAAKRYLKRIKWYLSDSHRFWFQSCLDTFDQNQTVVLIDTSDSAKAWMHEAVNVIRSLSNQTTGKLNFIQFNGKSHIFLFFTTA